MVRAAISMRPAGLTHLPARDWCDLLDQVPQALAGIRRRGTGHRCQAQRSRTAAGLDASPRAWRPSSAAWMMITMPALGEIEDLRDRREGSARREDQLGSGRDRPPSQLDQGQREARADRQKGDGVQVLADVGALGLIEEAAGLGRWLAERVRASRLVAKAARSTSCIGSMVLALERRDPS